MSTQTFRTFLLGPPAWEPTSPWNSLLAGLAAVLIVVLGQAVPVILLSVLSDVPLGSVAGDPNATGTLVEFMEAGGTSLMIAGQATLALLTLVAGSFFGGRSPEVLCLGRPDWGWRSYLYAVLLMIPVLAVVNGASFALSPGGYRSDLAQFGKIATTSQPVAALLAIAVGAPFWEELLFRGFLLGPLSRPLGFWPAAVLVTGTWTVLHVGYSMAGLLEVFLIGLYFSWLLRRTGSLWVPMACHALYNGALFGVMRYLAI